MKNMVFQYIIKMLCVGCFASVFFVQSAYATDVCSQQANVLDSLFEQANDAFERGNLDKAFNFFSNICALDNGLEQQHLFSMAYQRRGNILYSKESYAEAMQDYLKARGIAERHGFNDRLSSIYANIGNIFSSTGDLDTGIMFYRKALCKADESSFSDIFPLLYNNMLYAYYLKENPDSMRKYFRLFKEVNPSDERARYDLLLNKGLLDDMEGRSSEAIKMFRLAASCAQESGLSDDCEAAANSYIARCYERRHLPDSALHYLRINERMAREQSFYSLLVESLRDMARIYDSIGRDMEALQCKSEYLSISDSLFSRETLNLVKNSQTLYEQNSNAYAIKNLNARNTLQRYWILSLVIVIAVIALLSMGLLHQKRKLKSTYRALYLHNVQLMESELRYAKQIETLQLQMATYEQSESQETDSGIESSRKNIIPKEQREALLEKICKVAECPDFYCDPNCSIDRLAAAVDSNARYVSEVINKEYGINFRGFINKYRVREAIRRLKDSENYGHLTIKAISESVGYKSQATFIAAFSKETGLKPSLYQTLARQHQEHEDA